MKKSAKQQKITNIGFTFEGGLNLSMPPQDIGPNEMVRATNFMYDVDTDMIQVRPGTTCETVSASTLTNAIRALHYYEKSATQAWLCGVAGGTLYSFSTTGWNTIGAVTNTTVIPSFLTFHNLLLIGDGGTGIRKWDGTTYSVIATSPKATALTIANNRVVANAVDEPDSVYLSAPEDESDWDTTGTAVGIKVGYGDMLGVNSFGVLGNDIIVSKKSGSVKMLYRLNVADPLPQNWFSAPLSAVNAAQNPQSMISAYNNVFFVDTDGFKSVKGVEQYGDLDVDEIGKRISILVKGHDCYSLKYIPAYNAIFILLDSQVFVYTERNGAPRFTDLYFQQGVIQSICQVGDDVYLGGHDGLLYKFDPEEDTDESPVGTEYNILSALRSKTHIYGNDLVLRKIQIFINPISDVAGAVQIVNEDGEEITLAEINANATQYLYDATDLLYGLTGYLYDLGTPDHMSITKRNRTRAPSMALQVIISSGRCGVDKVQAEVAVLEGGE